MEPRWRIHGVSVEGYRHRRSGVPCQDAYAHTPSGASGAVLAVADGAGSRPRSEEGAKLAVKLAIEHFGRHSRRALGNPDSVHKLLFDGLAEIRDRFCWEMGDAYEEFASTLTVVVVTPSWLGQMSVGDGFVVVRAGSADGDRQYHLLPQADSVSEYTNETVFLTSPRVEEWVRTTVVDDPGIDGVLLSTDGLAQIALSWSGGQPYEPNAKFVASVLRSLDRPDHDPGADARSLGDLLRADRLSAVNADDKTLLRAVLR